MKVHLLWIGALSLLLISRPAVSVSRAQGDVIDKFTAFAMANTQTTSLASTPVDITITRWSTDDESNKLMQVLVTGGAQKFAEALNAAPTAALLRPAGQLGVEFQLAVHKTLKDGTERVTLMTERPLTFFDAFRAPAFPEYRFTLVELRLPQDGKGEGKISLAARIIADQSNHTIQFEDYASQPAVLLQGVQHAGKTQ